MKQILSRTGPEIFGLAVLGGAMGTLLGGAGPAQIGQHAAISAAIGCVVLPALFALAWPRVSRPARKQAA